MFVMNMSFFKLYSNAVAKKKHIGIILSELLLDLTIKIDQSVDDSRRSIQINHCLHLSTMKLCDGQGFFIVKRGES